MIRRIEPWTALRFSVLFYLSIFLVLLVAGAVLWQVATTTNVRDNVEGFVGELVGAEGCGDGASDETGATVGVEGAARKDCAFTFRGGTVLYRSALGGLVLVVVGTGANLLLVVLYNLISDVVGGVEITVLEEDTTARPVV